MNFTFYEKPNKKEIITNITQLQLHSALFFALKSKNKNDIESFLRNTLPRQSLSKNEFEKHVYSPENLVTALNLANFFINLIEKCTRCRPFDFCYEHWTNLSYFFDFTLPDHVNKDVLNKNSSEYFRCNTISESLSGSTCNCVYPVGDKQHFFNWCDVCCTSLEDKLHENAEVIRVRNNETRKYKLEFRSENTQKNIAQNLPACKLNCLQLSKVKVVVDKNNNNAIYNLDKPRHCQSCAICIKKFLPVSSNFYIDNITIALENLKKTIVKDKKVDFFVKKSEQEKAKKIREVTALIDASNEKKRKDFEIECANDIGLNIPSSSSKSSSKKPAAKVVVLDSEVAHLQDEMEADFKFYRSFFNFFTENCLKNYENRARRLAATDIYQAWDEFSDNKK